jgi:hypothetical protein
MGRGLLPAEVAGFISYRPATQSIPSTAKGGSGRLGMSGLVGAPDGMSTKNGPYRQMGKKWLEYWIRKTIIENRGNKDGDALKSVFKNGTPILTSVVSVNLTRTQEELKFAGQVFLPPSGKGFRNWPKEFVK